MQKMLLFLILAGVVGIASLSGCTSNQRAKSFGGTAVIEIPADKEFVNATWKEANLWYIVKERSPGHVATTYTMREDSNFGIAEGTVKFVEK